MYEQAYYGLLDEGPKYYFMHYTDGREFQGDPKLYDLFAEAEALFMEANKAARLFEGHARAELAGLGQPVD